jgi:nucleoid DNA-binding protein
MVSKKALEKRFIPKAKAIIKDECEGRKPDFSKSFIPTAEARSAINSIISCVTSRRVLTKLIDAFADSMVEELAESKYLEFPNFAVFTIGKWGKHNVLRARSLKRLKEAIKSQETGV